MSTREAIHAAFTKLGWSFDKGDEVWRDRDGQLIAPENVVAALPPDASTDNLDDYEWWIRRQ